MTQHDPTRRTQRQREQRRIERQHDRHTANAALRDQVRAIGGVDLSHWDDDTGPDLIGGQDE